MKKYKNIEDNSGVTAFEIADDSITIAFGPEAVYRYTYASAGKKAVEKMKQLAQEGKGLSTYISQSAREKYESKLK